ncbi:MAG: aspartate aminotransferase family protein [Deltaproteobacteria bacterium]|nr:aspartate aminotransferase family protein [Deltaproteobacteria bacterium]
MSVTLPARGLPHEEILDRLKDLREGDADWREGRVFSLVYHASDEHSELIKKAHNLFFSENGLNPMAFKSLRRMEAEVVRMSASMLHGGPHTVGTMTSGGTESILLAVKAARDRAKAKNKKLVRPNIVVPETVHVAFDKAGHYFGCEVRFAKLDASMRVDVADMASLIDANTVLLVGSAPQYPHGVVDPIEKIASLAQKNAIPCHVDACIGGFFLPWAERLGYPLPLWDFRVPGVTSISADIHKFGYAPKGASVLVYRDMDHLKHQFFVSTDWPGGIYASPTVAGTRPGGAIAGAWAALMAMGENGYVDHVDRAMKAAARLAEGIEATGKLELVAKPDMCIVSFKAKADTGLDVFALADRLEDRDWLVDRQQNPNCIHCTVTSNHESRIEDYLEDLRSAIAYLEAHPDHETRGNAAMYGMIAKVPFRGMVRQSVMDVMEKLYGPRAAEPGFDPMSADDEGLVMRLVKSYGGRALSVLDRVEKLRERLSPGGKKRRRAVT